MNMLMMAGAIAAARTSFGCSLACLGWLKPRSPNFLLKRDGVATIRISSFGCGKEKIRRPGLG